MLSDQLSASIAPRIQLLQARVLAVASGDRPGEEIIAPIMQRQCRRRAPLAVLLVLAAMALLGCSRADKIPSIATIAAGDPHATVGRGANLPFVELEAEIAHSDGRIIGPDRTFTALPSEASGRRAILLEGKGRFIEFTLPAPANAVTVRAALPDTRDGKGLDATLGVYVDGRRIGALAMTSRYGWFYGRYPFSNTPADGDGHHFYDESRLLLGRRLEAGTRVRLMIGPEDQAPWYAVDLADFELVPPPKSPPRRALSIIGFGADSSGRRDSAEALDAAIVAARAQRATVWIPPGTFRIDRHIEVDQVAIAGAGPWHSVLRGRGVGLYGRKAPQGSRAVTLRDFAIIGEVDARDDSAALSGIGGAIGGGSLIENLWLQHHKVGLWFDGPMDGLRIRRLRILDMTADGLNFRNGVTNSVVEDTFVRNTGDDGLAMWSHHVANRRNAFRNNTIVAPILANGIAIYGGGDLELRGNLVADTVTQGGGIHIGNRFGAVPVFGTITLADNKVVRGGSFDPNWRFGIGALWFYALDAPMSARITVSRLELADSSFPAIQLIGKPIDGIRFDGVRINGTGSHALQLQSAGSASFRAVTAERLGGPGILACEPAFETRDLGRNRGWASRALAPCEPAR